jgi:tetratricopeptide (TPR) repeat protein
MAKTPSGAKISPETIEEYRRLLARDPMSKVFASLAEAYRELGMQAQAEKIALDGIKRHPTYVSGYVALGRTLMDQERLKEALPMLKKASSLDPQNLLAWHLMGTAHLQMNDSKEALRCFKMVLFLNPQSTSARKAVQKLETLTADDYDNDIFEMKYLAGSAAIPAKAPRHLRESLGEEALTRTGIEITGTKTPPLVGPKDLERTLSLVDALILRNDLTQAREALNRAHHAFPGDPEVQKRFELLDDSIPEEAAAPLSPLKNRERQIFERKKDLLEGLLHRIKDLQN